MNQQRAKRFGSQPSYAKEHRMFLIEHESSDVELQKRIQEFNTALADHQTAVAAAEKPPEPDCYDLLSVDSKKLAADCTKHRQASHEARLRNCKTAVVLGRRYLEILEAASAEVSQRRIDADAEFEATKATTAEHLEAVGHGLSTQPSARVNHVLAAERQFDHKINTAEPVRLAKAAADTAAKTVVSHSRRIVAAKAFIEDAHTKLASFVQNSMKG